MRHTLASLVVLALLVPAVAGAQSLTTPPNGDNQRAIVTQYVGLVRVTIDYHSPDVTGPQGESRRGKIWGQLVPFGLANLGYGSCTECPWRAGANEGTTFEVSHDVEIQGKPLPAGIYGVHMIPGENEWTIIFSKNAKAWGSFFYDPKDDALRVTTKPKASEYHEWLTYEFTDRQPDKATVALKWEELAIPFEITVPRIVDYYVLQMKEELEGAAGFVWQNLDAAANYALQNGRNVEALAWATRAVNDPFSGNANFTTLMTLSQAQEANGKSAEAAATAKQAIEHPAATANQIHQYGRQLIAKGKGEDALAAYKVSQKRFGEQWPVNVSMMRGYSAVGNYKEALKYAKKALAQAPDQANKDNLARLIERLEKGENVN